MIMSSSVQGIGGEGMYKEVQKGPQEARQPWPGWPGEKKKKKSNKLLQKNWNDHFGQPNISPVDCVSL